MAWAQNFVLLNWVPLCGLRPKTPDGVGTQNFVLLNWVPIRGLCPHPPETEFLDFQFFKEKSKGKI